ncbi:MAG: type II secretion system F family protein [Phycisphaeraceae bacterium]
MDSLIPLILINALLFFAVGFLIWSLFRFPVAAEPPVHRRIAVAMGAGQRQTMFEQPALAPLMSLALTLSHRFSFAPIRSRVRKDLNASGNPNGYSIEEYVAVCLATGVSLGVAAGTLAALFLGQFDLLIIIAMAVVGFFLPLWTLHSSAQSRLMRVSKKLPYTLDLIALMMEAGATFTEAVETIIRDDPNDDFNQELALLQSEIEFGTPRSQALANLADRIPLDSLRSIVGAVNQAESLGTPLSSILKSQSGMLRMHRSVRAEKLSASASLRILIPSMLILLAVVLIVFGPILIRYIHGTLMTG